MLTKFVIGILTLLLTSVLAVSDQHILEIRKAVDVDTKCLALHCGFHLARCALDKECNKCTQCMRTCSSNDAICSSNCFFKYATPLFNRFTSCAVKHKCIPPITWTNNTCPDFGNGKRKLVKEFPVDLFATTKEMYVARGSHPIYDCFPCQKLKFKGVADTASSVDTVWRAYIEPVERTASYRLHQESLNSVVTKYELFGMPVEEHYYILDYTPDGSFVFYLYCGYGFDGEYQGSVIYSKDKTSYIPPEIEERFSKVLEANDLHDYVPTLSEFCRPDYSNCKNI